MAMRSDIGVASLAFVTRAIIGDIKTERTVFNEDTRENEKKETSVDDPVIVFFPSRACVVMSMKEAARQGYLDQPTILNLEAVHNTDTIAGRFKFSINEQERQECWLQMENALISACVGKGGYPLPREASFDPNSLYLKKREKVNAD